MKKFIPILFIAVAAALNACADLGDATGPVSVCIQLLQPEGFAASGLSLQGHTVTLSLGTSQISGQTDAQGLVTFDNLTPDIYDISSSWEISADDYLKAAGKPLAGGTSCTISGSLNARVIDADQTIPLSTLLSVNRDIIVSKIYFAGSAYEGTNRAYTAGQYIELYNQGDIPIDISGLYIALTETDNPQAYTLQNLHDSFADSVLVVKQIFQIPAENPFNVAPGASVLITNSAIDHSGISEFEHDLRAADFEAKDSRARLQNNPATPELPIVYCSYSNMTYINFIQSGLMGVVIFQTSEDISQWETVYAYGKTRGNMYKLLPKRYVIDGVECLNNKAGTGPDVTTKRLYGDIDAGYTYINAISGKTGEVVYRKTARRAGDRRLLMDTNNSSNDFKVSTTIKPREYDE